MNNLPQTQRSQVDQLLVVYHRDHPFLAKIEHTQEQGLFTEHYYRDALAYSQACCQWVQEQMQEQQGIPIHIYRLSRGGRTEQDRGSYNLIVDNNEIIHGGHRQETDDYVLRTMENQDVYWEAHMTEPLSGKVLREQHNAMEAKYASNGSYTPQYSYGPGPLTSERREEQQE